MNTDRTRGEGERPTRRGTACPSACENNECIENRFELNAATELTKNSQRTCRELAKSLQSSELGSAPRVMAADDRKGVPSSLAACNRSQAELKWQVDRELETKSTVEQGATRA